jgi:hypothetical protein
LRQQEVAPVSVADTHDIAHLAELGDALKKNDFHSEAPSCPANWAVRGDAAVAPAIATVILTQDVGQQAEETGPLDGLR